MFQRSCTPRRQNEHQVLKSPCQVGKRLSDSQYKTARTRTSPWPWIKSSTNDFELVRLILPLGIWNQSTRIRVTLIVTCCGVTPPSRRNRSNWSYRYLPTYPAPKVSLHIWAGFRLKRRSVLIPRMVASHHWPFDQAHKPNIRINCSSRTELNYHCNDEPISRVKLTCLTTV